MFRTILRPVVPAIVVSIFTLPSLLDQTSVLAAWSCADKSKHTLEQTQPLNVGQLKFQLRDYRYCGGYDDDFASKVAEAKAYVQRRAPEVEHPALVLDIDETSLSNWLEIEQDDFAYIPGGPCTLQPGAPCGDQRWELSARSEALKPTLELFNAAKSWGVTVFFITGRADRFDLRAATAKNLSLAGYEGWKELIMRPISSAGSVADYKSSARKSIEAQGYRVIANVGDQQSDLDGGVAERAYRVPNPFYFIP
jgi:predicted secreted acid phosphatase